MAFNYQQFATDIGMAAEDKTALEALFGKYAGAAGKIDEFVAAEVTARLTPLQADLTKKQADLDAQFETLDLVRSGDSSKYDEALKRVEDAQSKLAVAQERIRKVAGDAGLDPEPYLKDVTMAAVATETAKPAAGAFDPKDLERRTGMQAWNALTSAAELQDIAQEHAALFGKPLTSSRELLTKLQETVKRTGNTSLSIRDIWGTEFKVDAKREELRQADITRQTTDAYERGKREAMDAVALGSQNGQMDAQGRPLVAGFNEHSPISAAMKDTKPTLVNGVDAGVAAAIKTYGKIRQDQNRVA